MADNNPQLQSVDRFQKAYIEQEKYHERKVRTIRVMILVLFLALGLVSFLVMFFCADQLAGLMHDSMAAPGIKALAPAVICVGCLSAFRGYAQGHGRMTPTAVSQIIEALCKLTVGLGLAYWLVKHGADASHAAAGAITGVTVGTIVALAYMLMNFLITRGREGNLSDDQPDDASAILKNLLMIAVPITISSSMVGIVTVIDSSLVQGQLQRALLENPDTWALYQGIVDFTDLEQALKAWKAALPQGGEVTMALLEQSMAGQGGQAEAALALHTTLEGISRTLYGNYNGALNIYNLPTSLMAAVTAAVIPAVSGALARRDRRGAGRITGSALRITALVACPMAVGLYVLGKPIMALIFPSLNADLAGPLLSTLGLATLFVCMMLVCNSILQAHGFVNLPVDDLRERLWEVPVGKPVYVICQSGLRSYIACRILAQQGFKCYNLSGGWRLYEAVVRDRTAAQEAWPCGMEK